MDKTKPLFGYLCIFLIFGCMNTNSKSNISSDIEVLSIQGTANYSGSELPLELFIDQQGKFISKIGGWANQITGYDGENLWRIENGVGPYNIDFSEKEFMLMLHWPLIENWQSLKGITFSGDTLQFAKGLLKISMSYKKGILNKLLADNSPYEDFITFNDVLNENSVSIPKEIQIQTGFPLSAYSFSSVKKVRKSKTWYTKPPYKAKGVSFDANMASEIKVKKTETGHMFIRPKIQGKDFGWFLFDSGAGVSILTSEIAIALSLATVGEQILGGIGGKSEKQNIVKVENIALGPIKIKDMNFVVIPSGPNKASKILGEPVAGVIGKDMLLRAIFEVDMLKGNIFLHNPFNYRNDNAIYKRLFMHWDVPFVRASFEGNKRGIFLVDTGAGDKGVIFHSMAVDRLDLINNGEFENGKVTGAGGEVNVKIGKLEWFEIANFKTDNVNAIFMLGDDGEADLFTDGFIGGEVLKSVNIIFDYPNNKVGFIAR
jgi:hypothetical protein